MPVKPAVRGACDMLGYDVLQVANEGKMVCVVPADPGRSGACGHAREPLRGRSRPHRRGGRRPAPIAARRCFCARRSAGRASWTCWWASSFPASASAGACGQVLHADVRFHFRMRTSASILAYVFHACVRSAVNRVADTDPHRLCKVTSFPLTRATNESKNYLKR